MAEQLLDQACLEPQFSSLYAQLCADLNRIVPNIRGPCCYLLAFTARMFAGKTSCSPEQLPFLDSSRYSHQNRSSITIATEDHLAERRGSTFRDTFKAVVVNLCQDVFEEGS